MPCIVKETVGDNSPTQDWLDEMLGCGGDETVNLDGKGPSSGRLSFLNRRLGHLLPSVALLSTVELCPGKPDAR